jgi:glutamate dehydrogenase/leucine dehydrogenase
MPYRKPQNITPMMKAKVLMNDWLSNVDIMILAECGANKAVEIKKEIQLQIISEGKRCPTKVVRKERVLEHLEINQAEIFRLAEIQTKLHL